MKTRNSIKTFLADAASVVEAVLCTVPARPASGGAGNVEALARCVR